MHRDMKVGLSLGVLLVGIVAALFFRREADPKDSSPPALQDPEQIDRQIAERRTGPYMMGPEEFQSRDEPATPTPPAKPRKKSGTARDAYKLPEFLTEEDAALQQEFLARNQTPPPDPIRSVAEPMPASTLTTRDPAQATRDPAHAAPAGTPATAVKGGSAAQNPPRAADPAPVARTHTIQSGDTLSAIAARYLGSSGRYREIYDANRNVLRSPDDLPEGTVLTIPSSSGKAVTPKIGAHKVADEADFSGTATSSDAPASTGFEPAGSPLRRNGATATAPTAQTPRATPASSSAESAPATSEESSGGGRFAPVRRSPFSAGRVPRPAPRPATSEPSASIQPLPSFVIPGPPNWHSDDDSTPTIQPTDGSDDPEAFVSESEPIEFPAPRTYRVQRGDTLEGIAVRFYGLRSKSYDIFAANRHHLTQPKSIRPGMLLVIP